MLRSIEKTKNNLKENIKQTLDQKKAFTVEIFKTDATCNKIGLNLVQKGHFRKYHINIILKSEISYPRA